MSQATIEFHPLPAVSPLARLLVLDCPHGTTRIAIGEYPGSFHVEDDDAVRMALSRHHAEEGCRCTAQLWERYFGAALGVLTLVKGSPS